MCVSKYPTIAASDTVFMETQAFHTEAAAEQVSGAVFRKKSASTLQRYVVPFFKWGFISLFISLYISSLCLEMTRRRCFYSFVYGNASYL